VGKDHLFADGRGFSSRELPVSEASRSQHGQTAEGVTTALSTTGEGRGHQLPSILTITDAVEALRQCLPQL
jgi:hypothetical protein